MAEVYVFRQDGKILRGTMKNGATVVCMENLTDVTPCYKKDLKKVPQEILDFCKKTKQKFLYQMDDDAWETVK